MVRSANFVFTFDNFFHFDKRFYKIFPKYSKLNFYQCHFCSRLYGPIVLTIFISPPPVQVISCQSISGRTGRVVSPPGSRWLNIYITQSRSLFCTLIFDKNCDFRQKIDFDQKSILTTNRFLTIISIFEKNLDF